jgi:type IV secretory pathway VirB2 component (pilin)
MAFESRCGALLASSEKNSPAMKKAFRKKSVSDLASAAFAQVSGQSAWENAVSVRQQAFTSTIARDLSLVAIVVAGLTFAFGEGGSKRVLAGVLFGAGMAIAAMNFLSWLFPGT